MIGFSLVSVVHLYSRKNKMFIQVLCPRPSSSRRVLLLSSLFSAGYSYTVNVTDTSSELAMTDRHSLKNKKVVKNMTRP